MLLGRGTKVSARAWEVDLRGRGWGGGGSKPVRPRTEKRGPHLAVGVRSGCGSCLPSARPVA